MIEVLTFLPEHLKILENRKDIFKADPRLDANILQIAASHRAFVHTLKRDGEVIAIVGGHLIWDGVVEIWSIISNKVLDTPIAFHRAIAEILSFYEKNMPLHRIQAYVQADFTNGQRWLEMLGFTCEGALKYYGTDKSDHFIFARTR